MPSFVIMVSFVEEGERPRFILAGRERGQGEKSEFNAQEGRSAFAVGSRV